MNSQLCHLHHTITIILILKVTGLLQELDDFPFLKLRAFDKNLFKARPLLHMYIIKMSLQHYYLTLFELVKTFFRESQFTTKDKFISFIPMCFSCLERCTSIYLCFQLRKPRLLSFRTDNTHQICFRSFNENNRYHKNSHEQYIQTGSKVTSLGLVLFLKDMFIISFRIIVIV